MKAIIDKYLWERVFSLYLSTTDRGYAFELWRVRNKQQAHGKIGATFTEEDAHRSLDNAVRLLTTIGARKQATEAIELRNKVRQAISQRPPQNKLNDHVIAPWSTLATKARKTPAVRVIRTTQTRALGSIAWKETFGLPIFAQTDLVRVELNLGLDDLGIALPLNSIWLVVDSEQLTCLCPNASIAPNSQVTDQTFTIPPSGATTPLAFYGAKGKHTLYVTLSASTFPGRLDELLQAPQPISVLDQIAEAIQSVPDLTVLKTEFLVD